jgi:glycosyltransferase A (GT-A) superfamily protein (DUF2064 family)
MSTTGSTGEVVALVVAKAPVPGAVKTRLGREIGMERAARLAAAALLDTFESCAAAFGVERCHLALAGRLADSVAPEELARRARGWTVHPQRGATFAARLRHAHQDAAARGAAVVQIGMDTPQVRPAELRRAARQLVRTSSAVLGPAADGGWWLLGVGDPALVGHLDGVPMSTSATGALTTTALRRAGATVATAAVLRDVDTAADAEAVAGQAPRTRFARAWRTAGRC